MLLIPTPSTLKLACLRCDAIFAGVSSLTVVTMHFVSTLKVAEVSSAAQYSAVQAVLADGLIDDTEEVLAIHRTREAHTRTSATDAAIASSIICTQAGDAACTTSGKAKDGCARSDEEGGRQDEASVEVQLPWVVVQQIVRTGGVLQTVALEGEVGELWGVTLPPPTPLTTTTAGGASATGGGGIRLNEAAQIYVQRKHPIGHGARILIEFCARGIYT
jgi:hypothetical protein